jgi:hypothetical protein
LSRRFAVVLVAGALCAGCAGHSAASTSQQRAAVESYLRQVEPIRLAVNRLLDTADPILDAFRAHRITAMTAARRMDALERRFAEYTVEVDAIQPQSARLRSLQAEYAHTYILEDAYLSALANGLATSDFDGLPDTQNAQRAAIIDWRTGLIVLARKLGASLPADLQQAGRGEIAPSVGGS